MKKLVHVRIKVFFNKLLWNQFYTDLGLHQYD